jgi:chemotaxis protein MotA
VATVYGLISANFFFLPAANKLRARTQAAIQIREVMLEGVLAIVEGLNPKLIRTRLEAYERKAAGAAAKSKSRGASAPAGAPVSAEG